MENTIKLHYEKNNQTKQLILTKCPLSTEIKHRLASRLGITSQGFYPAGKIWLSELVTFQHL